MNLRGAAGNLGLRARVTLASVLALFAGLVALSVAINVLLADRLEHDASTVLKARAEAQLATIVVRRGRVVLAEGTQDTALDRQAWVYTGGLAIERPPAPPAVQRAADRLQGITRPVERDVTAHVRLRAVPVFARRAGPPVATAVVGISLDPYEHTERIALVGSLVLDLFVLLAGAGIAWRAVGAALTPVADMARDAEDWSEHDLDRRFGLGPPRDELTGLAATLDGLLGRIAASRRHEQRFSAEMAHELRTPLAGIQGEAELAARPQSTPARTRASLAAIVDGTTRMATVIETLLAVARGDTAESDRCDARQVIAGALQAMAAPAAAGGITLSGPQPGPLVRLAADAEVVARTLSPVLENAVRHARRTVVVDLAAAGGSARITVTDDGDGVREAEAEAIFEPGRRGHDGGGAGLGLALARRLARSAGGDVAAVPQDTGCFVVTLPV